MYEKPMSIWDRVMQQRQCSHSEKTTAYSGGGSTKITICKYCGKFLEQEQVSKFVSIYPPGV